MVGASEQDLLRVFSTYIDRHYNPLSTASTNLPTWQKNESPSTLAQRVVDSATENTSIQLLSAAFKCIYMSSAGNYDLCETLRKHQRVILRLSAQKNSKDAFIELSTLYNVFTGSRKFGKVSWVTLLEGFPPHGSQFPIPIVMSFYFFVIQSLLQHVLSHLTIILKNDPSLNVSVFMKLARAFLSTSNFQKWASKADLTLSKKYHSNSIKMVEGFIKVADFLRKKLDSSDLNTAIAALKLKAVEFQILLGSSISMNEIVEVSPALVPFQNDLKNTEAKSHSVASQVGLIFDSTTAVNDEASDDIHATLRISNPGPESFRRLSTQLAKRNSCSPQLLLSFSTFIETSDVSDHSYAMVKVIFEFIASFETDHSVLGVIDSAIHYAKQFKGDHRISAAFIEDCVPLIEAILVTLSESKRLRHVARLCFNFGKQAQLILGLVWASKLDLQVYTMENLLLERNRTWGRGVFYVCKLTDLSAYDVALSVASAYLSVPGLVDIKSLSLNVLECLSQCIAYTQRGPRSVFDGLGCQIELMHSLFPTFQSKASASRICEFKTLMSEGAASGLLDTSARTSGYANDDTESSPNLGLDSLSECEIMIESLMKSTSHRKILKAIAKRLSDWQQDSRDEVSKSNFRLVHHILASLFHLGYFKFAKAMIESLKILKISMTPLMTFQIDVLLCRCHFECGGFAKVPDILTSTGQNLKQMNLAKVSEKVDYNDVMQWKLLQFEYYIGMRAEAKSLEKFEEIRRFLTSKPEYDLNKDLIGVTLAWRFRSLLIIARYLFLVAKLQAQGADYIWGLQNLKLSIKLLKSVLRKLDCATEFHYEDEGVKKETECLLLASYKNAYITSRTLGLLKDALFFMKELNRLNCSLADSNPVVCAHLNFQLANYFVIANKFEEGNKVLTRGMNNLEMINLQVLKVSSLISSKMFDVFAPVNSYHSVLPTLGFTIQSTMTDDIYEPLSMLNIQDDILQLRYLLSFRGSECGLDIEIDTSSDRQRMLMSTLSTMVNQLSRKNDSESQVCDSKVHVVPQFDFCKTLTSQDEHVANRLIQCKETLIQVHKIENLKYLEVSHIEDVHALLNHCVHLLSTVSVIKVDGAKDLLETVLHLRDRANLLPYINQKKVCEAVLRPRDHLPFHQSLSLSATLDNTKLNVCDDVKQLLPKDWIVISIDICSITGDLIMSKLLSNSTTPTLFKLPFDRLERNANGFKSYTETLQRIIDESNRSTKTAVTSQVKTKEDRKNWWKLRFSLDSELKELINSMEQQVIGGLKGIFGSSATNDIAYQQFKQRFTNIWILLFNWASFEFSDTVVDLFYNLQPISLNGNFNNDCLEDLLSFTIDQLQQIGKARKLTSSLRVILGEKIRSLYTTSKHEGPAHIILNTSSECASFPWESMNMLKNKSVSRVPSMQLLVDMLKKREFPLRAFEEKDSVFYIVNPGTDLKRTQERFEPVLSLRQNATGLIGEKPEEDYLVSNLYRSNLFVYLGHGGGEQYMRSSTLMNAKFNERSNDLCPALLMGCSSGAVENNGRLGITSNVHTWLMCGSPMVVANLWDVTDKDIDIFGLSLLAKWGFTCPGNDTIGQAVAKSRDACTLKYLNGAAPILHGLPLQLR